MANFLQIIIKDIQYLAFTLFDVCGEFEVGVIFSHIYDITEPIFI